ncbi:MAG: methyl-accepting chemotaxis protein, partial [Proteobacteria bacterium]|nr:methyl-accepting chemotaxis protein [Pseudomonadota bacterium]
VRISGVVILSSVIAALVLYGYARNEICDSFYSAHIAIRRVSDLLWPVVAAGSAVSLLSGMLLAIFLPQKIAGPIFRIEKDLEPVRQGDLTVTITLRADDPLQDFAARINEAIGELRVKVHRIQDGYLAEEQEGVDAGEKRKLAAEELKSFKT